MGEFPDDQFLLVNSNLIDDDEYRPGYEAWLVDGDSFIPTTKSQLTLPGGFYGIKWHPGYDKWVVKKMTILAEELLKLPDNSYQDILDDISKFWKSKPTYLKYNYLFKRAILLYGIPGCGKSSIITMLADELINKYNGIIINLKQAEDIEAFEEIMNPIREIEPDRKIITIIEDIDNFFGKDLSLLSKLLNILDGKLQYDNMVVIATTNHPELLEDNITKRPSRFNLRKEIRPPRANVRKFYIESKTKKSDLTKAELEKWVKMTKGFTIDHLKELVLAVFVLGYDFDKAHAEIKEMTTASLLKNTTNTGTSGFNRNTDED
jgi:SpoVK/Ycf46/Vps4 family AAA+-type ATPase